MVDELNLSNIAEPIQANTDSNDEVVLGFGPKDTLDFLVDNHVFLTSDIALAIVIWSAHGTDFFAVFREEAESLIKGEELLLLVNNSTDTVLLAILVDIKL